MQRRILTQLSLPLTGEQYKLVLIINQLNAQIIVL